MREAIEIGSALRVLAPRMMRESRSRVTISAAPPTETAADTSAAVMHMKTAPGMLPESDDKDDDRMLREACLIMPLDWDRGFKSKKEDDGLQPGEKHFAISQSIRDKCIKELHEEIEERRVK